MKPEVKLIDYKPFDTKYSLTINDKNLFLEFGFNYPYDLVMILINLGFIDKGEGYNKIERVIHECDNVFWGSERIYLLERCNPKFNDDLLKYALISLKDKEFIIGGIHPYSCIKASLCVNPKDIIVYDIPVININGMTFNELEEMRNEKLKGEY